MCTFLCKGPVVQKHGRTFHVSGRSERTSGPRLSCSRAYLLNHGSILLMEVLSYTVMLLQRKILRTRKVHHFVPGHTIAKCQSLDVGKDLELHIQDLF